VDDNILAKINRATFKFLAPLSTEDVYKTIVNEAIKLVRGRHGTIILEQSGKLVRVYASTPLLHKVEIRSNGYTKKTLNSRKPMVAQISELAHAHPLVKKMGGKSSIYVPLSYRKKSIGVLIIQSHKTQIFTQKELEILKLFGSMASLAIRKTQLYDEARQALDVRDHFISMASHELRTPLTTISGYIQLLYSKLANQNSAESKWIEQLVYESQRLTSLVKELLDINRIKAGQLDFYLRECDLNEITKRAMNNFRFNYPSRELIFKNNLDKKPVQIIGDFDKLLQVLNNILDNAAKFSYEENPILMELKSKNNSFAIEISDHGKGMQTDDLSKLFQPFFKANDNQKTGIGLGLHLAKHIVTYHNGQIKVLSEKNRGTTVQVELPKAVV
jgi:signal transduction histidine kinase